jgi:outer membrane protein OmpA-like peptidoglycan-associated protein
MKLILTTAILMLSHVLQAQQSFTVYFDFNKYELTPAARQSLDSFSKENYSLLSRMSFALQGHCDAVGNDGYNDQLSRKRVATVKKYFREQGIEAVQITEAVGHGKRRPLNDNLSEEERQRNRRVEINFLQAMPNGPTRIGTLKETIADTATTVGTNIVLRNINFVGGRDEFLPESIGTLDELLDAMKSNKNLVIRIEGHICCQEGNIDGVNIATGVRNLSSARANAVMGFLLSHDINPDRVSAIGFGHSNPIYPYPENNEQERIENRRVEIKIIKK